MSMNDRNWYCVPVMLVLAQAVGEAGGLRNPTDQALLAFVHRTANTQVSDLRFLPVLEASIVIEALKSMLDRAKTNPQQPAATE